MLLQFRNRWKAGYLCWTAKRVDSVDQSALGIHFHSHFYFILVLLWVVLRQQESEPKLESVQVKVRPGPSLWHCAGYSQRGMSVCGCWPPPSRVYSPTLWVWGSSDTCGYGNSSFWNSVPWLWLCNFEINIPATEPWLSLLHPFQLLHYHLNPLTELHSCQK